jgi:dihydroorotate dehydrogenase
MVYEALIKPLLFSLDPETAHHFMKTCAQPCNNAAIAKIVASFFSCTDPRLEISALGKKWRNPIGLAAGFDKDADMVGLFSALGFSHLELGTVTGHPQPGNERPRIFRLPRDKALINRMGFPSCGAEVMKRKLSVLRGSKIREGVILGINIGKTKSVEIERAVEDYLYTLSLVAEDSDYVAVNVSSPNTQGLRQLQAKENLSHLLFQLQEKNTGKKPILVKLAPDLADTELDDALECCEDAGVAGVIATNTTISRPELLDGALPSPLGKLLREESGGLSGVPLRAISPVMVKKVAQRLGKTMTIIGVGGISTAHDVIAMMSAGAHLVQIYTGLVYEGPRVVVQICRDLIQLMDRVGVRSISELNSDSIPKASSYMVRH